MSLKKQRFFWPGMNTYIKNKVASCERCNRRKADEDRSKLVNITSTTPMEIVCLDYLTLKRSIGGFEKFLVITDHFPRYAQAIPTKNETAKTTARVLFDIYIVHYGFPACIHINKGANFDQTWSKSCARLQGLRNHKQHLIILWDMDRWKGLTEPYSKCLGLFRKARKVTGRHMTLLLSMPTMPHFMTALGSHLIFLCLAATLGWPLMHSLV